MARNYDGESSSSVRDEIAQEQQQQAALHKKIEFGLIAGAFVIAGLSVVLNIGKCVSYSGQTDANKTAQVEQEAVLEELNAQLQDPEAQNYKYKDPIVGNMAEIGQAMATEQNKMIRSNQLLNNMPGILPAVSEGTDVSEEEDPGHQASPAMSASGAVTLDPEDMAPAPAGTPDTEAVEDSEGVSMDGGSGTDDAGYDYTPITDFNGTVLQEQDAVTMPDAVTDQSALQSVTGAETELAMLIKDFRENYFAGVVVNVEGGDAVWSWYGNWVFSATYDYAVNEKPDMKAVWICYDVADTSHRRPLAFIRANYAHTTQKFTNLEAVYTKDYVKKADSQASSWGNASDASQTGPQTSGNQTDAGYSGQNGGTLSPDGQMPNGEGSENEFRPNITEDDADSPDGDENTVTITPDSSSENSVPSTDTRPNTNTGNSKPASNPPGQAPWSSGGGASSGGSSGSWVPGGGNSSANPDGSWTPGNGASGGSSGTGGNGSWTPSK